MTRKVLKNLGQEVVSEMCLKLKAGGVKDFHFYSMNRTRASFIYSKKYYLEIGTTKNPYKHIQKSP